jgi:hypothetical protein
LIKSLCQSMTSKESRAGLIPVAGIAAARWGRRCLMVIQQLGGAGRRLYVGSEFRDALVDQRPCNMFGGVPNRRGCRNMTFSILRLLSCDRNETGHSLC